MNKTVVEWRPDSNPESDSQSRIQTGTTDEATEHKGGENGSDRGEENLSDIQGPVTVTIDPPDDQIEPIVSQPHSQDSTTLYQRLSSTKEEEEEDLWAGLEVASDCESDSDEAELSNATCVCILSR